MDFGTTVSAFAGDWLSRVLTVVATAIVMGLFSWLFHRKEIKSLRADIDNLKSRSSETTINNVINNIVPDSGYRVDSKNGFVEFGTVKGKLRVRLGDPKDTSKDIAQWLHNKHMIATLDEAERLN